MILSRQEIERRELKTLAPYALKSSQSEGRVHKEEEHGLRTCYQRDRDRIIHSSAFRRLEYKTQVFVNHEGDYYRTRLTHSLETSQIGRSIARMLGLNEDVVEAVALAHDLGHTPFGHAGERILDELMQDHGGFNHNLQSLRIVDHLEERYAQFKGINLTHEVREAILKHPELIALAAERQIASFPAYPSQPLEVQVVDVADEIAYDNHDIDDGLTSGLLKETDLEMIALWREVKKDVEKRSSRSLKSQVRRYLIIRNLINGEVKDLITETHKNIRRMRINSVKKVRQCPEVIVSFSPDMAKKRQTLRNFLKDRLYHHYRVIRMSDKAQRFLRQLFEVYLSRPEQLPPTSQSRIPEEGVHRVICDYLAGMTDRYALDEYKKFFEPFERV